MGLIHAAIPDELKQAADLLRAKKVSFTKIVRARDEAILFVDADGHAMTAWKWMEKGKTLVVCEAGFPASPGDYLGE